MSVQDIKTNYNPADSEQFTTLLNTDHTNIKAALLAGGGGGLSFDFFGNGRLVQNDFAAGEPELTPSPSLAIIIPDGAVLRVGGIEHTLEDDVLLDGAPQNFTGYCIPSALWDEDSETYLWSAQWLAVRPALGAGTLCKVTTNADEVLTIDSSEEEADIIPWLPVLLARLQTLTAGGGGGGPAYASLLPWKPAPADSRMTTVVEDERYNYLLNRLDVLESATGTGARPAETKTDQLASRLALVEQGTARVHRDEGRRYESAHVLKADDNVVYGTGASGDRDFVSAQGLQPDADGKFNP